MFTFLSLKLSLNVLLFSKQCLPSITKIIYKSLTMNFVAFFPNVLPVEEQPIVNLLINRFEKKLQKTQPTVGTIWQVNFTSYGIVFIYFYWQQMFNRQTISHQFTENIIQNIKKIF